jgi:hypothetical protein
MIGSHLKHTHVFRKRPLAYVQRLRPGLKSEQQQVAEDPFDLIGDIPKLQERFAPLAIMLMGPRGRGKTLAMTTLGRILTYRYRDKGFNHCRTFSNYPSDVIDVPDGRLLQRVNDPRDRSVRDGLLLIDEIQTAAVSTKWNANENYQLTQFLTQIRKDRLEIIFTTQYPRGLDRGVLEQIDLFIECRKIRDQGIVFAVHDWKDAFVPIPKRRRPWPPFWHEADWYHYWGGIAKTYGHYAEDGHIIPLYMRDGFTAATNEEWRRLGYDLGEGMDDEDDGAVGIEEWADLYRVERAEEPEWLFLLAETTGASVFKIEDQLALLRSELPGHARSAHGFAELLTNNGYVVDGAFARKVAQ